MRKNGSRETRDVREDLRVHMGTTARTQKQHELGLPVDAVVQPILGTSLKASYGQAGRCIRQ